MEDVGGYNSVALGPGTTAWRATQRTLTGLACGGKKEISLSLTLKMSVLVANAALTTVAPTSPLMD